MKTARLALLIVAGAAVLTSGQILADQEFRRVPERDIPVPATVSPAEQAVMARPLSPFWNDQPKSAEEWKVLIARLADNVVATLPELRQRLGVKVEPTVIGGVKSYVVTPETIPEQNRNRLLVHVHGGGYVFGPGEAGTRQAVLMAGYSGMKVISVDYRMPPDSPYPAALDDAMTVWKEVVKTTNPKNIAIFATSTGGGMTLAMVLRAEKEGLPLPAATAPGTPWSDMTKTGDSYFTNEMVDNVLVSNDGWLGDAANLYANGHDLKDPMLSPVYGDFQGFPPTILTSGTRDLFLSNTVRVHRKMRAAGVDAELEVFEGQSHAQYQADPFAPETKEYFAEVTRFLDKHLAK
ncbi:MAG: alpha/beta hydrolase [Deltaproteobacteria bacterium]|nr:alpha/beta hydrolase [Deltaproteobacteria bacterium]